MPSFHDLRAVDAAAAACRIDRRRLSRLRTLVFRYGRRPQEALDELDPESRAEFCRRVRLGELETVKRHDSIHDGASKLVLQTVSGNLLETVLLRSASGRTSVCVSSQIGCAAGCKFCATGQLGLVTNLTAAHIADQVLLAGQILAGEGRRVDNVVLMGMGEPLQNERAVHAALELLVSPSAFALPPRRITVSTVGIPAGMIRLAQRFAEVRLALSLHSARKSVREELIPLARRYDLPALADAIRRANALQRQPVMIEYLLLAGRTDTEKDFAALVAFLAGLRVHVNLIAFNPIQMSEGEPAASRGAELTATSRGDRERFANRLKALGVPVTLRRSLGGDIAAACGQLAGTR